VFFRGGGGGPAPFRPPPHGRPHDRRSRHPARRRERGGGRRRRHDRRPPTPVQWSRERVGFYLRKALRLGPLRVNLSRAGVGLSAGVTGARFGVWTRRGIRMSMPAAADSTTASAGPPALRQARPARSRLRSRRRRRPMGASDGPGWACSCSACCWATRCCACGADRPVMDTTADVSLKDGPRYQW
jgi:hypothetical protein